MNSDGEDTTRLSSPDIGSESRGSSVSTELREEYEDLLRYAVVTPVIDLSTKASKSQSQSKVQYHPSPVLPPRPNPPPNVARQPEVTKVASDISDPSDLQQESGHQATPLTRPPPPFTAMSIQQEVAQQRSHDSHAQSHDSYGLSHDQSMESNDTVVGTHEGDPEVARLETQLDGWCLDLKRNILAEFEQCKLRLLERREKELQRERQQHAYDLHEARAQVEQYKELLATYEQSIGRKDHVIANLTKALQKQKERVELQRTFGSWKLRHNDDKREGFSSVLARKHYHKKIKGRVWGAWFGLIQARWKQRVEKACQSKAEEVCVQLTGEYEEQLEAVQQSLEESQAEVQRLKAERDLYEENMKKAFMRGVCALNMEAMSMFRYRDTEDEPANSHRDSNNVASDHDGCAHQEHSLMPPPQGQSSSAPQESQTTSTHPHPLAAPAVHSSRQHSAKNIRISTSANHMTQLPNHITRPSSQARRGRGGPPRQRPEVVIQKH